MAVNSAVSSGPTAPTKAIPVLTPTPMGIDPAVALSSAWPAAMARLACSSPVSTGMNSPITSSPTNLSTIASCSTRTSVAIAKKRSIRPRNSVGVMPSASSVEPRTSANSMLQGISAPARCLTISLKHIEQYLGFFAQGPLPMTVMTPARRSLERRRAELAVHVAGEGLEDMAPRPHEPVGAHQDATTHLLVEALALLVEVVTARIGLRCGCRHRARASSSLTARSSSSTRSTGCCGLARNASTRAR